ncbi:hypothetical protein DCAR_0934386 [Daucus carota subsp. sativus]|uniref:Uncharacterized protein n=1 Tax=Daucus carota subsp. sativus TaxID=79200 RepID=A0A175YBT3_DAUCS|nr:hypothetical protein DCAR_0934386 [Daucus carota subsp. sativus]
MMTSHVDQWGHDVEHLFVLFEHIGEETFFIHIYNDICIELLNVGDKVLKVNDIIIEKDNSRIVELSYTDHDNSQDCYIIQPSRKLMLTQQNEPEQIDELDTMKVGVKRDKRVCRFDRGWNDFIKVAWQLEII